MVNFFTSSNSKSKKSFNWSGFELTEIPRWMSQYILSSVIDSFLKHPSGVVTVAEKVIGKVSTISVDERYCVTLNVFELLPTDWPLLLYQI